EEVALRRIARVRQQRAGAVAAGAGRVAVSAYHLQQFLRVGQVGEERGGDGAVLRAVGGAVVAPQIDLRQLQRLLQVADPVGLVEHAGVGRAGVRGSGGRVHLADAELVEAALGGIDGSVVDVDGAPARL